MSDLQLLFPGNNQRPLSQRFLAMKGHLSTQKTWAAFLWSFVSWLPCCPQESQGSPPPGPFQPTDCAVGASLGSGWARGLQQCIVGNFPFQVHNDQVLGCPLHPDLLSDLQAGGAGEA